jgi:hypothetical protein
MGQTKSKDVYAAAVLALGQMGAEARPALPAILKNAERLGVLEGAFCPTGSKTDQGDIVLEAVGAIARGQAAPVGGMPMAVAGCPTPAATYGPPQAAYYSAEGVRRVPGRNPAGTCYTAPPVPGLVPAPN